jgi:hypothetical protein
MLGGEPGVERWWERVTLAADLSLCLELGWRIYTPEVSLYISLKFDSSYTYMICKYLCHMLSEAF